MSDKKKNILISILFIIFGAFVYVQSLEIDTVMQNDVGSAFFPKVVAVAIIGIGMLKLVLSFKENDDKPKEESKSVAGGWLTILLLGVYVMIFNRIGFIISSAIYLFFQILVLAPKEKRNIPAFSITAAVTPVFIYAVFVYAINMPLPKGIFGF